MMDITNLFKQRDAMIEQLTKGAGHERIDAATIARAPQVRAARADLLCARIEMIERQRAAAIDRADAAITAIRSELHSIEGCKARDVELLNRAFGEKPSPEQNANQYTAWPEGQATIKPSRGKRGGAKAK